MVVGFNHNFRYKGEIFHVQTEDGGLRSAAIVTLLYHGGTILASKKTTYGDLRDVANLSQVVEELMKEQHKEMLRRLKDGDFDAVIGRYFKSVEAHTAPPPPETERAEADLSGEGHSVSVHSVARPAPEPIPAPVVPRAAAAVAQESPQGQERAKSLDDIILSYLLGEVQ